MQQYDLRSQQSRRRSPRNRPPQSGNRFWRGVFSGFLAFVTLSAFGVGALLIAYVYLVNDFDPWRLADNASDFQSTRIYDSNGSIDGELLYETFRSDAGRRTEVPLSRISPWLQKATIATEDANFYAHPGVDPVALARAIYYAFQEREFVSGASTIPQQLVKMLLLTPERTFTRKIREAILATEISNNYERELILELYLNELYYGNLAYGSAAAADTYFGKDVAELTLAEAALLAGIPQLPAVYDPYTAPEEAKERQGVVLGLMVKAGFITQPQADEAWLAALPYVPVSYDLKHPHFTLYARQQLEEVLRQLGQAEEAVYTSGLEVTTTLDVNLQREAERIVREQVDSLAAFNAANGALVAMRPDTGEIVALVGSADFNNVEIDGQVNMALAPRQPGSSIKPFVYLAAFENSAVPVDQRWTPGTLVADISEDFPDGANPPYRPVNYDGRDHGLMTVRDALARSYNITAVRALQQVGLPYFLDLTRRLGITTLTRPDYGLSLSLGGGEIPLLEMTGAYATIANRGRRVVPIAIRQIAQADGTILCQNNSTEHPPCLPNPAGVGEQVISEVDAFLITDVLRDNEARTPVFGPNSALYLGDNRPAAAKTGTTNDIRDVLTMGFTPQLVTGVWVGNADRSPMLELSGASGAAPIWQRFMTVALADKPAEDFVPPIGLQQFEVCADTGTLPSAACPNRRVHWFAEDRRPLPPERDLNQFVRIDRTSGRLATEFTPADVIEEKLFKVYPEQYRRWAEENGIPQPPTDQSQTFSFAPDVAIIQPSDDTVVSGLLAVLGTANAPAFASYELQYGIGHQPEAFSAPFAGPFGAPLINGVLGEWDVTTLTNGPYTLRLLLRDAYGNEYDYRTGVVVAAPTATPIPSPTWTVIVPTPTETQLPTAPPTELPVATATLAQPPDIPTEIPTAAPTLLPTAAPIDTPLPTAAPPPTDTPTPAAPPAPVPTAPLPTATLPPVEEVPPTATIELIVTPPDLTATPTITATLSITGSFIISNTGIVTGTNAPPGTNGVTDGGPPPSP